MRHGLCNDTGSVRPSVCLSVCSLYRLLQQRAAGLLLWARQAGDIDRQRRRAQQQMRAVSRCQLMKKAEHADFCWNRI